jgi:hypothetical protein
MVNEAQTQIGIYTELSARSAICLLILDLLRGLRD